MQSNASFNWTVQSCTTNASLGCSLPYLLIPRKGRHKRLNVLSVSRPLKSHPLTPSSRADPPSGALKLPVSASKPREDHFNNSFILNFVWRFCVLTVEFAPSLTVGGIRVVSYLQMTKCFNIIYNKYCLVFII